jgi:hypothetical protein
MRPEDWALLDEIRGQQSRGKFIAGLARQKNVKKVVDVNRRTQ